jgi:hypothetical protein
MRTLYILAAPALAAPILLAAAAAPAQPGAFPMIRFFEGRTEGKGTLKVALSGPRALAVQSRGQMQRDGTLVLRQTIEESGKAPRNREWRIREVAPGRYAGTLTDATGPVTGETQGNRVRIRYRMKGGLDVEQWLTPAPGGRSARNSMTIRKFGLTFASVEETIRKLD